MITGGGRGAAYLRSTEASAQFVDPLAIQDRIKENKRYAEQKAELKAAEKKKEQKEFMDSFELAEGDFVKEVSGIKQVDDAANIFFQKSYDKYDDYASKAEHFFSIGNTEEARRYKAKANKIKNNFKNFNQLVDAMKSELDGYKENKDNISDYDAQTAMLGRAYGDLDFVPQLDENDNPYLAPVGKDDEGNFYQLDPVPINKIVTSLKGKPKFDLESFKKSQLENVGYITQKLPEKGSPYYTETKRVRDEKKAAIASEIASLSVKENPMFFDLFARANGGVPKYKGFGEADEQKVKGYLERQFEGVFDEETKRSKDDVKDAQANRAQKKKELEAEQAKENKVSIVPVKDIDGNEVVIESPLVTTSDIPENIIGVPFAVVDSKNRRISEGVFAGTTGRTITDITFEKPTKSGFPPRVKVTYRYKDKSLQEMGDGSRKLVDTEKTDSDYLDNREITVLNNNLKVIDGVQAKSLSNALNAYRDGRGENNGKEEGTVAQPTTEQTVSNSKDITGKANNFFKKKK